MRVKAYETRNQLCSNITKLAKGNEAPVFKWIDRCYREDDVSKLKDSGSYPLLDRIVGVLAFPWISNLCRKKLRKKGRQPKGRVLLWHVLAKYKLDCDRGTCLTQHRLLSLKISGKDAKALENFRTKYDFVFNSLEKDERPSESSLRTHLFEELKEHPLMLLQIDKFRCAKPESHKRASTWL